MLTVYDDFGGYGHPDHIQGHRVGLRAAELAGTPEVYQGTMNNDHIRRTIAAVRAQQEADGVEPPRAPPRRRSSRTRPSANPSSTSPTRSTCATCSSSSGPR